MTNEPTITAPRSDAASAAGGPAVTVSVDARTAWIAGAAWAVLFTVTFWDFFRAQVSMAVTQVQDWPHAADPGDLGLLHLPAA